VPASIGISYDSSIGSTYTSAQHNQRVVTKLKRSVLDRAVEAAREHLRRKEDPTLEDVGKIVGVKQSSVSLWADGSMRMKRAIEFATKTGVCVEWLLTERGPKYPPMAADPNTNRLLGLWPRVSDVTKGRILQLAENDVAEESPGRHTQSGA
jgi:hypothetical protein